MNISLTEEMRSWVEEEIRRGGFANASEYFQQLLRDAKSRLEEQSELTHLQELLIQGIDSGQCEPAGELWWQSLRDETCASSAADKSKAS
jgi:antitoxin ParD1/3/4